MYGFFLPYFYICYNSNFDELASRPAMSSVVPQTSTREGLGVRWVTRGLCRCKYLQLDGPLHVFSYSYYTSYKLNHPLFSKEWQQEEAANSTCRFLHRSYEASWFTSAADCRQITSRSPTLKPLSSCSSTLQST